MNFGKRLFDLIGAVLLLVLFSPVLLVTAILVRSKLGTPVIFIQQRAGYQGRPFAIYKFRSMTNQRDAAGNLLPDAMRFTSFGNFLRRSSLDELPQLLNVLKGDLSLVGPRPLFLEYLPHYTAAHARRLEVKPGITGWAQVNGRNLLTWEEKFQLDVWYVDNATVWLDLKILAMTVKKVLAKEGIDGQNHLPVPYFAGNLPENTSTGN
ncbi:sugar transferase [Fodinisporobacter ferrooxydans]|uniref:Sugar transferase n=1 Tax=Fodinisporobacter ferrooxydans TaxID=2901836 RepID=A0ABY4CUF6_9BACL|nr:sugar transferase [Alicyclobacillaceae bacterium MYW30-H2]